MCVTKSDERHEYAACEFLKWFTAPENSLRFVCESSYLPVRKDANTVQALDAAISANNLSISPKAYDCLKDILENFDPTGFFVSLTVIVLVTSTLRPLESLAV